MSRLFLDLFSPAGVSRTPYLIHDRVSTAKIQNSATWARRWVTKHTDWRLVAEKKIIHTVEGRHRKRPIK